MSVAPKNEAIFNHLIFRGLRGVLTANISRYKGGVKVIITSIKIYMKKDGL